jgi:predicted DNA-binding WGR domain protein
LIQVSRWTEPHPAPNLVRVNDNEIPSDRLICLEARDPPRNIARRYVIAVSNDLFGAAIVQYSWCRIGTRGQRRNVSFPNRSEADQFVESLLKRRASSPARIGVAYSRV